MPDLIKGFWNIYEDNPYLFALIYYFAKGMVDLDELGYSRQVW